MYKISEIDTAAIQSKKINERLLYGLNLHQVVRLHLTVYLLNLAI